ncbi:MAG: membrane protein insertion efficiency factor YidD, partial [Actinomycetota bacterium]|nr:membrane protein insertion efficiency factor YidD [Actinomycetota bacterium]
MTEQALSPLSRFAVRFIRTYQLDVRHRVGARCGGGESCSDHALRMFEQHGFITASGRTIWRIATCRPPRDGRRPFGSPRRRAGRVRRMAAMAAVLAILGAIGFLFSPASADVTQGCYGNANGRRFDSVTQNNPLRVTLSQRIALRGGATATVSSYLVNLYFFGIPYGMRDGATTDNTWQGTFTASSFLTRGTGNYMVDGYIYANQGVGTFCFARLYIKVQGDPLSETPGQAAAGVTATGLIGMIATAVTGGKVPPGFEQTSTPEEEELIRQKQEEETKREERRKKEEEENQKLAKEASRKCVFLVLPALLLTTGMMVSGASAGSPAARARPPVQWRPRFSIIGIGSAILFALGSGVLLQQYGVIWPTLGMG